MSDHSYEDIEAEETAEESESEVEIEASWIFFFSLLYSHLSPVCLGMEWGMGRPPCLLHSGGDVREFIKSWL
jgi:hypothetical protein